MSTYIKKWNLGPERLVRRYPIFSIFETDRSSAIDPSKKGTFVYLDCPDWVNVIALTKAHELVMVEQYRHGIHDITLEIPGGLCEKGESIISTGLRELVEETGYSGASAEIIGTVQPNPAYQNNYCHTIVVHDVQQRSVQKLDEHEEIQVQLHGLDMIDRLVQEGRVQNAMVISALYFFRTKYKKQK